MRVSAEVMVERNVLLEDHHDVFYRRLRRKIILIVCEHRTCWQHRDGGGSHERQGLRDTMMHIVSLLKFPRYRLCEDRALPQTDHVGRVEAGTLLRKL